MLEMYMLKRLQVRQRGWPRPPKAVHWGRWTKFAVAPARVFRRQSWCQQLTDGNRTQVLNIADAWGEESSKQIITLETQSHGVQ